MAPKGPMNKSFLTSKHLRIIELGRATCMKNLMVVEAAILGAQAEELREKKLIVVHPDNVACLVVRNDRVGEPLVDNDVPFVELGGIKQFAFWNVGDSVV